MGSDSLLIIGLIFVNILSFGALAENSITLEKLSTLYLPKTYVNNSAQYGLSKGAVEAMAYDHVGKTMYIVGMSTMHVVDISNTGYPKVVYHHEFEDAEVRDVEFCGNYVFVSVDNKTKTDHGYMDVYRKYNSTSNILEHVRSIRVGNVPDVIKSTSDCHKVLVTIKAKAYNNGTTFMDPEAGIGIVKFNTDDIAGSYTFKALHFRKFNDRWEELVKQGVRFVYRENGNTLAQDIEPENIAMNVDGSVAYIALQESNAIAEVNLTSEEIAQIHPLGFKDWTQSGFDASDKDEKINIKPWPVYGMYQPDFIEVISVNNKPYLLTANEGDVKDYEGIAGAQDWTEDTRLKKIWNLVDTNSTIYKWSRSQGLNDTIADDENLGRLKVSKVDGKDNHTGKYSAIYTYGGRGFSIIDLENMNIAYDSGSDIETQIARHHPQLFNTDVDGPKEPEATLDKRSDNKGPETESLAVAQLDDRVVLFIGNERPGFIAIYSIKDNVKDVKFESLWTGITDTNGTWDQLYASKRIADVDPDEITFIDASKSPNGQPILLVAGSVGSTLSILRINGLETQSPNTTPSPSQAASTFASSSWASIPALVFLYLHPWLSF